MSFALDPRLACVSSEDWKEFCSWLRECCGYSSIQDLPINRQYDAYLQFLDERYSEEALF